MLFPQSTRNCLAPHSPCCDGVTRELQANCNGTAGGAQRPPQAAPPPMKQKNPAQKAMAFIWAGSRVEVFCAAIAAPLIVCVFLSLPLLQGCATTPAGIAREEQAYNVATNVAAGVQAITPYLPAPVQFPTEMALAALAAVFTAWNTHQQKAISALRTNGTAKAVPTSLSSASKPVPPPSAPPA